MVASPETMEILIGRVMSERSRADEAEARETFANAEIARLRASLDEHLPAALAYETAAKEREDAVRVLADVAEVVRGKCPPALWARICMVLGWSCTFPAAGEV